MIHIGHLANTHVIVHFQRTANTLQPLELREEVEAAVIQVGTIDDGDGLGIGGITKSSTMDVRDKQVFFIMV